MKKYTVELIECANGTIEMKRVNDGFNVLELIGVLRLTIKELDAAMLKKENFNIEKITRQVVVDAENKTDNEK